MTEVLAGVVIPLEGLPDPSGLNMGASSKSPHSPPCSIHHKVVLTLGSVAVAVSLVSSWQGEAPTSVPLSVAPSTGSRTEENFSKFCSMMNTF